MKKWCLVLILPFAFFAPLSAATVSVLIVESGLPSGAARTESAVVWENGLLDALFDAGHIVSNIPILRLDAAPGREIPLEARHGFYEARAGGADFFIMVLLTYGNPGGSSSAGPETGGRPVPSGVFISVFTVSNEKLIYETSVTARSGETPEEAFLDAKRNAGNIIPRLILRGRP
ncbi:MAG: hypothetical protein LBG84_07290 [Treponema sp.]|jgi:hypothetical protein|nr:hypothetical protein [Treponema sp.]